MTPLFRLLFDALDARLGLRRPGREAIHKIFPTHWSFLLGEVALFSFVVVALSGIFLAMFYRASHEPVVYAGSAELFQGRTLPAAYASIVTLSHDVTGGLLFRRIHRGAAYLFVAATVAHLLRVLLTGAFRRPREANTHIGTMLLVLTIALAYTGQNLPYDLLAGSSLRISYATLGSVPFIGESLVMAIFGGPFPGQVVHRFYALHVLILPGILVALLTVHLLLVARQRHTQFPVEGVDAQRYVVGAPLWPSQFATSTTLLLVIGGVLAAFAVVVPWSDFDLHGPLVVGQTSNSAHPDWWLFFVQGAITVFPAFEWFLPGFALTHMFVFGAVLPLALFGLLFAYPFLERRLADYDPDIDNHVCSRPLDVPVRAGLVIGVTTFVAVLTLSTTIDTLARGLRVPVESVVWAFRLGVVVAPPLVGWGAYARARTQVRRRTTTETAETPAGPTVRA